MFKPKIKNFLNHFSPEGKTIKYKIMLFIFSFIMVILSCSCLGLMGLYFSAGTYKFELFNFYMEQPKLILLNTVPYVLLGLLVWFVSNRPWIGFLFSGIVCLAYSFTNYWKLVSRDDPFFAEDIALVREALQMSDEYVKITWQMYFAVFLVVVGTLILALFVKGKLPHFSLRVVFPCLIVLMCIFLYKNIYTSSEIYSSFSAWNRLNPWFENSKYISRGGIYPFINSIQSAIPKAPEGYSTEEAKNLLNSHKEDEIPQEKKVNIMFVMFEAFSDLSKYTDLITMDDPYQDFHRLQEESYSGELVTNIFAGGTVDTERTVLTGFSRLFNFRKASWSYARYFADMGYSLDGSHAGFKAFYNRHNINRNLGIDEYRFIENYYNKIVEGIPMDDVFLPEISSLFAKQMEAEEMAFSFNVTYQNHGPYPTLMGEETKEYIPLGNLKAEDHAIVNNYLTGVENTSMHMYQMAEQFKEAEEPVVLVFFGDHKPWLGEYSSTYTALGIDIFEETEESFYNHYNTEYLIWANAAAKEVLDNDFVGEGPSISPCFLMNVLFEQCGWEGPSFMKISKELMEVLPVITNNDRFLQDEKLVSYEDLKEENCILLANLNKVQFYLADEFYKDVD